jgi:uncharacterized membrane-anchored protein
MPTETGSVPASAPSRVPQITIYFWIVKILTTAAGESTSDFLAHISPALIGAVGVVGLALGFVVQFRMRRYVPWAYWFAVLMVAIFGTMAADVLHEAHIGYLASTIGFAVILLGVYVLWYRSEGTLSIHSITNRRREWFYWSTVVVTFALGTAAGDMTATTWGWGYLKSGVMFTIAFAAIGIAYALARGAMSPERRHGSTLSIIAFWLAYILTRPLGASFADWFGATPAKQGLGYGDGTVTIVLLILIAISVAYLAVSKVDAPDDESLAVGFENVPA